MSALTDKEAAWRAFEAWRQPRLVGMAAVRITLCEAQNWRCCYCGVHMTDGDRHDLKILPKRLRNKAEWKLASIEHVLRRADGGTDDWENLAAACSWCNASRGERAAEEWFSEVQALILLGAHPHSACR